MVKKECAFPRTPRSLRFRSNSDDQRWSVLGGGRVGRVPVDVVVAVGLHEAAARCREDAAIAGDDRPPDVEDRAGAGGIDCAAG